MNELRRDPITGRWTIVFLDKTFGVSDFVSEPHMKNKEGCPFCWGHESLTPPEIIAHRKYGPENSPNWSVRVVPNKFPALRIEGELNREGIGVFDMMNGIGAHEVIVDTPDHFRDMADLSLAETEEVVWAYVARSTDLRRDKRFKYILIFKNYGKSAGASLEHPHSQLIALPNDEMKGRIIGREGRNIRAFETLTGVDLIVDDTPEAVLISGFDPVRRETARLTLTKLVVDGRIHPARVEEMFNKAKEELKDTMWDAGEKATFEADVHGLPPVEIQMLGRLKYRTSYGQNVLQHSIEVAKISGLIAAELGVNVKLAKRAGLLHDLGKAIDQDTEGTHTKLGVTFAQKAGESDEVLHAIEAHHYDVEPKTVEAVIVAVADAISASRPGARRDTLEAYIKRLENLEKVACSFEGVEKCYAIQAGREVRIIVQPDKVDDLKSTKLAYDIARKIEAELEYPGEVKVTVIRETRATDVAK